MKKNYLLLILMAIINVLNADSTVATYFKDSANNVSQEHISQWTKDAHYINAVNFLENPRFMKEVEVNKRDPESKNKTPKIEKIKISNYKEAYKEFENSFNSTNNPISAFYNLYLIKTAFGKNTNLKDFKKYSEFLYKQNLGICSVYIDYGETLEKGYFTLIDNKKALEVYKKGLDDENCNQGWTLNVLMGKYSYLKKKTK